MVSKKYGGHTLAELRKLHDEATEGLWEYRHPREYLTLCGKVEVSENQNWAKLEGPDVYNDANGVGYFELSSGDLYYKDADFICATHDAMPELLDRVEKLEGALRNIKCSSRCVWAANRARHVLPDEDGWDGGEMGELSYHPNEGCCKPNIQHIVLDKDLKGDE